MIVACKICNKEFYVKPGVIKKGHGKYCSYRCAALSRNINGIHNIRYTGGLVEVPCMVCGEITYNSRYDVTHKKTICCSHKCKGIIHNQRMKGDKNPAWSGGKVSKICLLCGKQFYVTKYSDKQGEQSANWKGGISPEHTKIRNTAEYNSWRLKVFGRDYYTCKLCGQYGGKLNAHHISSFTKDKEKRHDIDNGITLCFACHKRIHSYLMQHITRTVTDNGRSQTNSI
jgi:hypothetical protein